MASGGSSHLSNTVLPSQLIISRREYLFCVLWLKFRSRNVFTHPSLYPMSAVDETPLCLCFHRNRKQGCHRAQETNKVGMFQCVKWLNHCHWFVPSDLLHLSSSIDRNFLSSLSLPLSLPHPPLGKICHHSRLPPMNVYSSWNVFHSHCFTWFVILWVFYCY